jgi:ankyrin repeat protein
MICDRYIFSLSLFEWLVKLSDAKSQIAWSKREEIFELASEGKLEELRELLGKVDDNARTKDGVNFVDAVDGSKRTPLHYAADREQVEVVKLLVESGATVDMKDEDGMTALLTAVMCEHEDIVKVLVDHGADVNAEDIDGETPLSLAEGAIKNILSSK